MVTRQNPQTAGISRDGLVQTEFKGKIGDGFVPVVGVMLIEPGIFVVHVGIEFFHHRVVGEQIIIVFGSPFQLIGRDLLKHDDRVVLNVIPQCFVQSSIQIERIRVP